MSKYAIFKKNNLQDNRLENIKVEYHKNIHALDNQNFSVRMQALQGNLDVTNATLGCNVSIFINKIVKSSKDSVTLTRFNINNDDVQIVVKTIETPLIINNKEQSIYIIPINEDNKNFYMQQNEINGFFINSKLEVYDIGSYIENLQNDQNNIETVGEVSNTETHCQIF